MRAVAQEYKDAFSKETPYGGSQPKAVSEGGALWATPEAKSCPNTERPGWLLDRWHCAQDHYLEQKYGVRCEGYWQLYEKQQGRCTLCRGRPRGWRLVIHHDHETGEVVCLLHFTCNRLVDPLMWLLPGLLHLLTDPPGRQVGLRVPETKLRKLERKDHAKRKKPTTATPSTNSRYAEKVTAARQAIEREPT